MIDSLIFASIVLVAYFGASFFIPNTKPRIQGNQASENTVLNYFAIGDSLTEGVGDSTGNGGFVPILANLIQGDYQGLIVEAANFGISGNTSNQILQRLPNEEIQASIKKADFVTMTVGANDILRVVSRKFPDLTVSDFDQPRVQYKARLQRILNEIRELNPDVPIFVLGIYNPFYLNFPTLTAMQDVIDSFNDGTKNVLNHMDNTFFIPINALLYKGIDGKVGVAESIGRNITNDALYAGDNFHPNDIGYRLMAKAVYEVMNEQQKTWLPKGMVR
ncbi:MAG: SGNH/GDSL hydrolase family protein [Streptococcaceae bacterium]|nr:SGNH/GDSL hydrolase family protein [Streptococcaceae bacterium]